MPRTNYPKRSNQTRKYHNKHGRQQVKSGASFRRLVMFARKHGMKVEGAREVYQLRRGNKRC